MIDFTTALFYCLATALVTSASLVAFSNHPVRAVMSLILTFVLTAALWILLSAEFLGLLLIFVYVGAVMTLFLFVVMMLNLNELSRYKKPSWSWLALTCSTYIIIILRQTLSKTSNSVIPINQNMLDHHTDTG